MPRLHISTQHQNIFDERISFKKILILVQDEKAMSVFSNFGYVKFCFINFWEIAFSRTIYFSHSLAKISGGWSATFSRIGGSFEKQGP